MNWNVSDVSKIERKINLEHGPKVRGGGRGTLALTSPVEQAFIDAQILTTAVLLKDFDLIPGVMEVAREMNLFAKVNHVYSHSALLHRAPQRGGVLEGKKLFFFFSFLHIFTFLALLKDIICRKSGPHVLRRGWTRAVGVLCERCWERPLLSALSFWWVEALG